MKILLVGGAGHVGTCTTPYLCTGHGRCDTFFISGDADHREMNMSKARTVLGWEPKSHLMLEE